MLGLPQAEAIADRGVSQSHESTAYNSVCCTLFEARQRPRQQLPLQRKEQDDEPQSAGQPCLEKKDVAKKPRLDRLKLLAFRH